MSSKAFSKQNSRFRKSVTRLISSRFQKINKTHLWWSHHKLLLLSSNHVGVLVSHDSKHSLNRKWVDHVLINWALVVWRPPGAAHRKGNPYQIPSKDRRSLPRPRSPGWGWCQHRQGWKGLWVLRKTIKILSTVKQCANDENSVVLTFINLVGITIIQVVNIDFLLLLFLLLIAEAVIVEVHVVVIILDSLLFFWQGFCQVI